MEQADSQAQWRLEDSTRVYLSGDWNLLFSAERRLVLKEEFDKLDSPRRYAWNLRNVGAFDSGGAQFLWRLWGGKLPATLECTESQQHWFERLDESGTPEPPSTHPLEAFARNGAGIISMVHTIGGLLLLLGQLLVDTAWLIRHPRLVPWKEISATIFRDGASSMLLLGVVGFAIGMVMTIQIAITLERFGAAQMVISLMGLAVLRELGAVIAGLTLAGRSGSAMTAGIGAMHITEEFNALRAFGTSPTIRLVFPRVVGMVISVPLLVVWTDFTGLIGAAISSDLFLGVNWWRFLVELPEQVPIVNFWIGIGKGALFGFIIAWVATYFGLTAKPNTESLSHNTTISVVSSLTLILIVDAIAGAFMTQVGL